MAFKMSRKEQSARDQFIEEVTALRENLESAVETYNVAVGEAWEALSPVQQAYNDKIAELKDWSEEIRSRMQDEFDGKSEKWQDSERGSASAQIIEAWGGIDWDESDLDAPESLSIDDVGDAVAQLNDDLPDEPEE